MERELLEAEVEEGEQHNADMADQNDHLSRGREGDDVRGYTLVLQGHHGELLLGVAPRSQIYDIYCIVSPYYQDLK